MGNKNMKELSLEDMNQISGGVHGRTEIRRYEIGTEVTCPHCGKTVFSDELQEHITKKHPDVTV